MGPQHWTEGLKKTQAPSSWDEQGRAPGGQSTYRVSCGRMWALQTVLGPHSVHVSSQVQVLSGHTCPIRYRVSRGREELGVGISCLLMIGSRMSDVDCFFLAVTAAKANY